MNPQLVKDVASLSFRTPLGSPSGLPSRSNPVGRDRRSIPGIMNLYFVPTIGSSTAGESSAINIAAKNIYSFVRHENSGRINYDAPDLMLYLLALDSAFM